MTDPAANPLRHHLRHKGFRDAIRKVVGEDSGSAADAATAPRSERGRAGSAQSGPRHG
jgi:hypothetical protein